MDCHLGTDCHHVDLWSWKLLQRHQVDDWLRTNDVHKDLLGCPLSSHPPGHPHRLPLQLGGASICRGTIVKHLPSKIFHTFILGSVSSMGSLGGLDTGWVISLSGASVGRTDVPGVRLQEEGQAGGHSNSSLGSRRSRGQEGDL